MNFISLTSFNCTVLYINNSDQCLVLVQTSSPLGFLFEFCFCVVDVKDLHEEVIVWNQQDELVHLLHLYMRQHYPGQPNKLYQVLACLADLTRTCMLAKEHLTARQAAGEVPHYSLLSELLKGDITVSWLNWPLLFGGLAVFKLFLQARILNLLHKFLNC